MIYPYEEKSENGLPWHTTFIGQYMQHNYWLYNIVDKVMIENPQIQSIVEIGTGCGALTTVFGLWGIKLGIPVASLDKNNQYYNKKILDYLNVKLLTLDENCEEAQIEILNIINNKPTWLYCDGGCKSVEFRKFAPLIPKDSIISAHDLGTEFSYEIDAKDMVPNIVTPYKQEYWTDLNIQLAIFKKS